MQDASSGNIIISASSSLAVLRHFFILPEYSLYGDSITGRRVAVSVESGMSICNWQIFTVDSLSPMGFSSICLTTGSPPDCAGEAVIFRSVIIVVMIMFVIFIVFTKCLTCCKCIVF